MLMVLDSEVLVESWEEDRTGRGSDVVTKQCLELVFAEPRPWALARPKGLESTAIKLALDL